MLWLKSCPRCQEGDVTLDRDMWGWNIMCLQCGYMKDVEDPNGATVLLRQHDAAREPVPQSA